jgi:hypothetical protein
MFTAEELEECDIFPKKFTTKRVLKVLAYTLAMGFSTLVLYSLYSGRDISSLVRLEGIKYNTDSLYLQRLWALDNKYDYNLSDRYTIDAENLKLSPNIFFKEYLKPSLPVILKNITFEFNQSQVIPENKEIYIEKRQDHDGFLLKESLSSVKMNYSNFKEEASSPSRIVNYYLNEMFIEEIYNVLFKQIEKLNFISNFLKLRIKGIKYSEGYDEFIIPGHYEYSENIFCQLEGETDMLIASPLQRNAVYPFYKKFGMPNFSAVNFFKTEYGRFPNFRNCHRLFITLSKGDCLYVPAYWWFSTKSPNDKQFSYIKFEFKSHSRWVDYILRGMENDEF